MKHVKSTTVCQKSAKQFVTYHIFLNFWRDLILSGRYHCRKIKVSIWKLTSHWTGSRFWTGFVIKIWALSSDRRLGSQWHKIFSLSWKTNWRNSDEISKITMIDNTKGNNYSPCQRIWLDWLLRNLWNSSVCRE